MSLEETTVVNFTISFWTKQRDVLGNSTSTLNESRATPLHVITMKVNVWFSAYLMENRSPHCQCSTRHGDAFFTNDSLETRDFSDAQAWIRSSWIKLFFIRLRQWPPQHLQSVQGVTIRMCCKISFTIFVRGDFYFISIRATLALKKKNFSLLNIKYYSHEKMIRSKVVDLFETNNFVS